MSPGESRSQRQSSQHRNPADPSTQPSHPAVGHPSTLIAAPQTAPVFQSPVPSYSWPVGRAAQHSASASRPAFPVSLHSQDATTSLNPSTTLPSSLLDPQTSLSGPIGQYSLDSGDPSSEQWTGYHQRGLGITPYPMSVTSDGYFAGPMQEDTHNNVWANRPFQPSQPQSGQVNQPLSSSSYPTSGFSGFSGGYHGQPSGPMQSYQHQQSHTPYLAAGPANTHRQNPSQSPPLVRPFHPHSAPATPPLSDQTLMTSSPPYMMNQPAYYFPDASSMPSSHPSSSMSVSPHAPSIVAGESIYSSSEPVPPSSELEHQVRVISQRPRPQCWDHGCNGREFSTFSNLLRHQREKSGVIAKAECPNCGAVFTRTTARNIHVAQGKCKADRELADE